MDGLLCIGPLVLEGNKAFLFFSGVIPCPKEQRSDTHGLLGYLVNVFHFTCITRLYFNKTRTKGYTYIFQILVSSIQN